MKLWVGPFLVLRYIFVIHIALQDNVYNYTDSLAQLVAHMIPVHKVVSSSLAGVFFLLHVPLLACPYLVLLLALAQLQTKRINFHWQTLGTFNGTQNKLK